MNAPAATSLESRLKQQAHALGFALAGIAPATDADGFVHLQSWLARGFAGEMDYLHRSAESRKHPNAVLPGVRSVVMLGMEYSGTGVRSQESGVREDRSRSAPNPESRIPNPAARVASYAQGPDYHTHLWDKLNTLAAWLESQVPGCVAHGVTDTAPLLERDFARRAGLGWVGKNTMLINPRRGSFFFLGAFLTDLELAADPPFAGSHCGTCTACLDACPTDAFPQPHVLDATKCISYLTIELKSPMPLELREKVGDWLFGCDVCQDVCPWNRGAGSDAAFPHDPELESIDPIVLLGMSPEEFRRRFKKTSIFRPRRTGLLRNAAIVLGNIGDERALPALEKVMREEADVVREAAAWAMERIRGRINQRTSSV
jgi:epoxyqueuosine reductase